MLRTRRKARCLGRRVPAVVVLLLVALPSLPTLPALADQPVSPARADQTAPAPVDPRAAPIIHPEAWPAARGIVPDARISALVERVLRGMTLEEKVGQILQADIGSITPQQARQYYLGSILAGGNAGPQGNVRAGAAAWLALTDAYWHACADGASTAHPPIPVLFGIDAVHGHGHIPGATLFPHNIALGATHDPALIERIGTAVAQEIAATGIDWDFSPTVAVARDVRWGRSYESFSEDPAQVSADASAMLRGLQGLPDSADFLRNGHVLATVKHFVGDGGTVDGRDQFNSSVSEATLRDVHAAPYRAAVEAGALAVMASYNGWQGLKMHVNRGLLTGVLRGRWGFQGLVAGDWNAQEEIPGCTKYDCPAVLMAGVDMYMAPDSWQRLYGNVLSEVSSGRIPEARLDEAVRRILTVKALDGLFDKPAPRQRPDAGHFGVIGSAAHRRLARQAVRESLVLLKNNGHLLPLDPRGTILVTGPGADDIGMQCGGWSIDWQGAWNTNADFPGATSIYTGVRAAVEAAGGRAILSRDGSYDGHPSAALVVFGERPYAEFQGDRETVEFSPGDHRALTLLKRLHAAGIPVVTIFLSGRPLWVNPELNASDAFIAAWLPGTEGGGVADLLFAAPGGAAARDFTGRLAFSWPATGLPVRFAPDGSVKGALFERGYGLSLADSRQLAALPEDLRLPPSRLVSDTLFHDGHVTAPWSIFVEDPQGEVRLTMASQMSPTGALTATLAGDAVTAAWSGAAAAALRIGGRAIDENARLRDGTALALEYRVDTAPTAPVRIGLRCEPAYPFAAPVPGAHPERCGRPSGAGVDVTRTFAQAPTGIWQQLSLPLSCFAAGADLARVAQPLVIETAGRFVLRLREVRYARGSGGCPQ